MTKNLSLFTGNLHDYFLQTIHNMLAVTFASVTHLLDKYSGKSKFALKLYPQIISISLYPEKNAYFLQEF